MAELVDAPDLESGPVRGGGSSPPLGTKQEKYKKNAKIFIFVMSLARFL